MSGPVAGGRAAPGAPVVAAPVPEFVAIGDPGRSAREVGPSLSGSVDAPADTVADGADLGAVTMRSASVRGLTHRKEQTRRQDSVAAAASTDGRWLLLAIADGLTAAAESDRGSSAAASTAVRALDHCVVNRSDLDWGWVVDAASAAILRRARREHSAPDMEMDDARSLMATTLLVGAISLQPIEGGLHGGYFALVGDCSAMLLDPAGRWHPISPLKAGNGAGVESSNGVRGLPRADPRIVPFDVGIRPGDAVFLMSDGVGDPLGDGTNSVAYTLAQWWASPPAPIDFAAQVGFARRGYVDDRSAIGVWVAPAASDGGGG